MVTNGAGQAAGGGGPRGGLCPLEEMGPTGTSREIIVPTEIPLVDGRVEIALSSVLIVFGALAIALSQTIRPGSIPDPIGSDGFPILAGAFLILVGALQLLRQVHLIRQSDGHLVPCPGADTDEEGYPASALRAFSIFAAGLGWGLTAPTIGFLTATTLVGFAGISLMGVGSWVKRLLVPCSTAVVMWLVFDRMFGIQLPAGPLERSIAALLPSIRI